MPFRWRLAVAILVPLAAMVGCTTPINRTAQSPLKSAQLSPDSVVLDVFYVRFPYGDAEANEQLWREVDEQALPVELRRQLARNGLRAGLVGGQLPLALSKLLELKDKPAPDGSGTQLEISQLSAEPRVERRRMPLRSGIPGEIIASEVYPELPVLFCESGALCGQTYAQAQGILSVTASPQGDGRVRLQLVPEMHHDQPRQRWIGQQGIMRLDTSRPKRVFDDLSISANLAPGAMLLVTCLPDRTGSLGHQFFTEKCDTLEQKLLVIRLSQTQQNDLFAEPSGSTPTSE